MLSLATKCPWPFSTTPQPWLDASECIVIDGSGGHTGTPNGALVRAIHHSRSSLLAGFNEEVHCTCPESPPNCSSREGQSSFASGELGSVMEPVDSSHGGGCLPHKPCYVFPSPILILGVTFAMHPAVFCVAFWRGLIRSLLWSTGEGPENPIS